MTIMNSFAFSVHLLAGEDCGVAPLPNHTSSILVKTLLMKPALDMTFSLAERLVMVDSGCGRETGVQNQKKCEKYLIK